MNTPESDPWPLLPGGVWIWKIVGILLPCCQPNTRLPPSILAASQGYLHGAFIALLPCAWQCVGLYLHRHLSSYSHTVGPMCPMTEGSERLRALPQGTQPVSGTAKTETHSYQPLLLVPHQSLLSKSPCQPGRNAGLTKPLVQRPILGSSGMATHPSPASQPAPPPWPPLGSAQ